MIKEYLEICNTRNGGERTENTEPLKCHPAERFRVPKCRSVKVICGEASKTLNENTPRMALLEKDATG